jgi:DNA polymerase V
MSIIGLVDCNNFYASCERVFNPRLENKPIVILSNNDGCIIARSNEAKALGIPMGAPYFQWRKLCEQHRVHVFSSNFELYGDLSARVMSSLEKLCPEMEIYSIDEAFLCLDSMADYRSHALLMRKLIKQWTGIPVSIGLSTTKTLAKCANKLAKANATSGVFDLTLPWQQDLYLASFPVEDVWGIGRRLTKQMQQLHIKTAKALRDYDAALLRKKFSIMVEKIIRELRGTSCLSIEHVQEKKQIMCSRSFGKKVSHLEDLEEAVSHYAANACVKLRKQKSMARGVLVFLQKSYADHDASNSKMIRLEHPTDDTSHIIAQAKRAIRQLFQPHCLYHKAGVMLLDLQSNHIQQVDLFLESESNKNQLMTAIDQINESMGRNALFFAAEGTKRTWKIQSQMRSPRHTTCWNELVIVKTD